MNLDYEVGDEDFDQVISEDYDLCPICGEVMVETGARFECPICGERFDL